VSAKPSEAIDRIAVVAKGAGIDLGKPLNAETKRFERLQENGLDLSAATFATEFGRNLEYYSGLVFQIETKGRETLQIAGGGRYDGLLTDLGAPRQVPAIGAAIHTERLLAAVQGASR
jgi:ATP phosphoribosyltransferase regulatory subunit